MKMRRHGRLAGLAVGTSALAMAAAMVMPGLSAKAATAQPAVTARPAAAQPASVGPGSGIAAIVALQHRLHGLHYWVNITGKYDFDTQEAVMAFQGVNGLTVDGVDGPKTTAALANPRSWAPFDPHTANRVEVDIKKNVQVLVLYKNYSIVLISHISSAGNYWYTENGHSYYAQTPTGTFHALYMIHGWHQAPLGYLYNPVYFNYSGYAIHGDTSVPATPASHGCVRIPDDLANTFYTQLTISENGSGTKIDIFNR